MVLLTTFAARLTGALLFSLPRNFAAARLGEPEPFPTLNKAIGEKSWQIVPPVELSTAF